MAGEGVMPYGPEARRPIAGMFRRTADVAVRACVRWTVHPDAVSYSSILASALAGGLFFCGRWWPWAWAGAPVLCYVRLWLNMLDGMVALASGKASRRGEVVNEVPDRVSDVLIFGGLAMSGWGVSAGGAWAYWAMAGALMTAYIGVLGQAVRTGRQFGGIMSKPWRMVALHAGAWGAVVAWRGGWEGKLLGMTLMDWVCGVVLLGCVQTCAVRLGAIWRTLGDGGPR